MIERAPGRAFGGSGGVGRGSGGVGVISPPEAGGHRNLLLPLPLSLPNSAGASSIMTDGLTFRKRKNGDFGTGVVDGEGKRSHTGSVMNTTSFVRKHVAAIFQPRRVPFLDL